jgi:hypothetical protein
LDVVATLASCHDMDIDLTQIHHVENGKQPWLDRAVQLLDKRPNRVTGLVLLNIMTV